MSRIRKAYEAKFQAFLRHAGARKLEKGLSWLVQKAERLGEGDRQKTAQAFTTVHQDLLRCAARWVRNPSPSFPTEPPIFLCDAGLGALARWLRAAGYEADWTPGISDDDLVREASRRKAIALTTDSLLVERRVFRDGEISGLWVPPTLTPLRQLELVFAELRLPLRAGRCMRCGGTLQQVEKEAMRERIPPRTFRWLEEYFLCRQCGQLFWHGTHWKRIQDRLARLDYVKLVAVP